ncbi:MULTISPECIES: P-type DNA transfer protein VirB5 [unclassified Leisingera]|uniref:P-type DNA transfer protein VirB5 n=1 Tax=unclassified Leisingera TaxID=2614906 RepID=UPI001011D413|nr:MULTISPECIES: P-type DNA transfer protein VirB5 [unclassified Leisingera]MCF6433166.1 P-type DNA transfer protein VirB5 [Leisingera sp. MMG026]QAX32379.1 P-type DNA transfer protein VirB5 [Leisingera sp. NJS204]
MKIKAALLLSVLAFAQPAFAGGVPVIDAASIANAKQEFAQEIAQMVKELEEAKRLYDSVNGLTDMADIAAALNNPQVRELLGPDAMQIASSLDIDLNALGDLSGAAQDFLEHTRVTSDAVSAEDFYRQELDRIGAQSARDAAIGDRIVQSADDRLTGLERLRQEIGGASTQKEINALQTRLQVESAMLQNDTNRIQGLAMLQEAQTKVEEQRNREIRNQNREARSDAIRNMFSDQ